MPNRAGWMIAGLVVSLLSGPIAAQQPTSAQRDAIKQACRTDYMNHCASVPSGGTASLQCLQQNAAQLSAPCQQALAALNGAAPSASAPRPAAAAPPMSRREMLAMLRADCGRDARAYCADVTPGGGRMLLCLKAHEPQLSQSCQSALAAIRESR